MGGRRGCQSQPLAFKQGDVNFLEPAYCIKDAFQVGPQKYVRFLRRHCGEEAPPPAERSKATAEGPDRVQCTAIDKNPIS